MWQENQTRDNTLFLFDLEVFFQYIFISTHLELVFLYGNRYTIGV